MKQTAVEWFEQQLDNLDIKIPFSIYEEAKEMEKGQIIDAVNFINNNLKLDEDKTGFFTTTGDGYYKNNYGK